MSHGWFNVRRFFSCFILSIFTASICFVVLRIVSYVVEYEEEQMDYLFPKEAEY